MANKDGGRWMTWRAATQRALYGEGGFYRRTAGPADHFRTSAHESPAFAESLLNLARTADLKTVVDVGSGRGELLRTLHALDPTLRLLAVELAERPPDLPDVIGWTGTLPAELEGLVVANEWLDNVPVDAARREGHEADRVDGGRDGDDVRMLLVDPATGAESVGDPVTGRDRDWLDTWWPLPPGGRAEIGHPRDDAWAAVVGVLRRGIVVAADYEHRRRDRPFGGSLTGYAAGRQVSPVPDGSCDITSHVALDSCAAAGLAAGADWSVHTTQREALQALEALGAGRPMPPYDLAVRDPAAYLASLSRASHDAELSRRGGLGDFGWLVQGRGVPLPHRLARLGAGTHVDARAWGRRGPRHAPVDEPGTGVPGG